MKIFFHLVVKSVDDWSVLGETQGPSDEVDLWLDRNIVAGKYGTDPSGFFVEKMEISKNKILEEDKTK